MKEKTQYVYWLHLQTHSDVTKQGYVGVSATPPKRFYQHKRMSHIAKSSHLHKAVLEHGDSIIQTVLLAGKRDYCLDMERMLRPKSLIGWNTRKGGSIDPPDCSGNTHSNATKQKISESNLGKCLGKPSKFKGVTGRYTKEQMEQMVASRRAKDNYAHTEETKAKLKASAPKGKDSHTAVPVVLIHKDNPETLFKFDSVREAAEALNINYGALRSQTKRGTKTPNRMGYIVYSYNFISRSGKK